MLDSDADLRVEKVDQRLILGCASSVSIISV